MRGRSPWPPASPPVVLVGLSGIPRMSPFAARHIWRQVRWEPGSRRWLIERRRIGPLVRNLRRATDPLFRRVGMDLDEP